MSCYGVLLDPGPGDAMRFLHGFCELLKQRNESGVVFCTPIAFRKNHGLLLAANQEISLVECANFQEINRKLRDLAQTTIWHCYDIKFINRITKHLPKEIMENTNHEFYMVDRFGSQQYMEGQIADHLKIPAVLKKNKGLLFLRNMSVRSERNMNSDILNAIVAVSKERNIIYDVVDGNGVKEWEQLVLQIKDKKLYLNNYPEYIVQMSEYSSYRFAIGMNSGGLDMAIAAGTPGIRIGEFHQYYNWLGRHYNDFLSSKCTVNIASRSETDISNIGEYEIRRAFEMLFTRYNEKIIWV